MTLLNVHVQAAFSLIRTPGRGVGISHGVEALVAVEVNDDLVLLVDVQVHSLTNQFVEYFVLVLAGERVEPLDSIQFFLCNILL